MKSVSYTKYIFLIDGLGAVVTAFSLGIVLPVFDQHFGVPKEVLYWLATGAGIFAIYSLSCHFIKPLKWRSFLKGIAIANVIYCLISIILLWYLRGQIMPLGWMYFLLEIIIVLTLVTIEWRIATAPEVYR